MFSLANIAGIPSAPTVSHADEFDLDLAAKDERHNYAVTESARRRGYDKSDAIATRSPKCLA